MLVRIVAALVFILVVAPAAAKEPAATAAYAPMAPFAKLAGTAWRGEGEGPDSKSVADIVRYEMIIGGRAFQATHRLEDGSYGGRTIFFYDEGAKKYIFHYFTTAGFHTLGEITPTDNGFVSVEKIEGNTKYAEVRAEMIFENEAIRVKTTLVDKSGKASGGGDLVYHRIEDPGVLFFDEADALFGKRTDVKDSDDRYKDEDQ